jgi:hypothetical protein
MPPALPDFVESLPARYTFQAHDHRASGDHNTPEHALPLAGARIAQRRLQSHWACLPGDKPCGRYGGPT